MNTPPLTRREYVGVAVLQSLIAHPNSANVADDVMIAAAVRNTDKFLAELDRTAAPAPVSMVSPPAESPAYAFPPELPAPPEDGLAFFGKGPLNVVATGDDIADVFAINEHDHSAGWKGRYYGNGHGNFYALRRGTPIARANGIPD